jgi:2'-5' RNA ligase
VSFPTIETIDRTWIERIRADHDPQAAKLAAHFTLVFPTEETSGAVAAELAGIADSTRPVPFTLRRAKAVVDASDRGCHVFLVPDEGSQAISELHDRLHGGVLGRHLREDFPFVPHVTVAASADFPWCEAKANGLNRDPLTITGILESLDLLQLDDGAVSSVSRFMLRGV